MQPSDCRARNGRLAAGHLRAFEAVARNVDFRATALELSLSQSAVSRQIQAPVGKIGVALFPRHTRAVDLSGAGARLLAAVVVAPKRLDATVRHTRQSAGRLHVTITSWASIASMWLVPRLEDFPNQHPGIDIRVDTTDSMVDLDMSDADLAVRHIKASCVAFHAGRMFGGQLASVASPWLPTGGKALAGMAELPRLPLIDAGDVCNRNLEFQSHLWLRCGLTHRCVSSTSAATVPLTARSWLHCVPGCRPRRRRRATPWVSLTHLLWPAS